LRAFASLCREFPEAHYLIAGTGPEEQKLRQLTGQLGIQERVTFTGYVASETLPSFYHLCDIMLLANRKEPNGDVEGFGIVFLEANAAGKPVIGGRSGGAIEAVADGVTGRLVDPDASMQLETALRELLENPNVRQTMGAAGRRRVESEFNWKQRAQSLDEVNRHVLDATLQSSRLQLLRRSKLKFRRRPEEGSS
jgi:phosphatidylinositol alpha-1,6-mannosyltransferase